MLIHRLLLFAIVTMSMNIGAAQDSHPNVLFLICDDLNCDLGCYGHPQVRSPNIDRLAKRGVQFDRAYCQYPLCGPSRASFMTGLYPDQTLIHQNAVYIRETVPNVLSMSQMLIHNDYFATRIGKIYHYGVPGNIGTSGHDDPFSWNYTINPRGRDKDEEDITFTLVPGSFGGTLSWLAADGTDEEQTDGIAATEAVELLHRYAEQDRRFMLAVGSLSTAHTLRGSEEVLRTLPNEQYYRANGARRLPGHAAEFCPTIDPPQKGTSEPLQRYCPAGHSGLSRVDFLRRCAGWPYS